MTLPLLLLLACGPTVPTYIVEGTVVEVRPPSEVVLDHKEIKGLGMPGMIMPFEVGDPALLQPLHPGSVVVGRLEIGQEGAKITSLRVTGEAPPPSAAPVADDSGPVRPGDPFPTFEVPLSSGGTWTVGAGQPPTIVTFIYTRCPIPEACPAVIGRLQALEEKLAGTDARILALTLDPAYDTADVLEQYAASRRADPKRFAFGRLDEEPLRGLSERAALRRLITAGGTRFDHGIRFLVIGRDGRLIERYDDTKWPLDRVVSQLTTGGPPAPAGADGTLGGG